MTHEYPPPRRQPSRYAALAEYEESPYPGSGGYYDGAGYRNDTGYQAGASGYPGQAAYPDAFDGADGYRGGRQGAYQQQGGYQGYGQRYANGQGYADSRERYRDPHPFAPERWAGYQDRAGYGSQAGYGERDGYQDTIPERGRLGAADIGTGTRRRAQDAGGLGLAAGAVAGFLAVAALLGVATLVAGFVGRQASPVTALDRIFARHLPAALQKSAAHHGGAHSAAVLGLYVVIAIVAMVIGAVARRKLAIGVIGVAALGLAVAYAVISRPGSMATDALPAAVGTLAGIAALGYLIRASLPEVAA